MRTSNFNNANSIVTDKTFKKSNDLIIGICDVYIAVPHSKADNGYYYYNIGYTEGGVKFSYTYELYPVTVAKYGNRVIGHILVGESCRVQANVISLKLSDKNKPEDRDNWWWWRDEDMKFKTLDLLYPTLGSSSDSSTTNTLSNGDILNTVKVKLVPINTDIRSYFTIIIPKAVNISGVDITFRNDGKVLLPLDLQGIYEEGSRLFTIGSARSDVDIPTTKLELIRISLYEVDSLSGDGDEDLEPINIEGPNRNNKNVDPMLLRGRDQEFDPTGLEELRDYEVNDDADAFKSTVKIRAGQTVRLVLAAKTNEHKPGFNNDIERWYNITGTSITNFTLKATNTDMSLSYILQYQIVNNKYIDIFTFKEPWIADSVDVYAINLTMEASYMSETCYIELKLYEPID